MIIDIDDEEEEENSHGNYDDIHNHKKYDMYE